MYGPSSIIKADLQLRAPHLNEAGTFVKWLQDPDVTRYLSSNLKTTSIAEQKDYFRKCKNEERLYFWVIAELGTNKVIGSVQLKLIGKPENRVVRFGIMIGDKSKWNQGRGQKVLTALLDFAFLNLGVNRFELSCFAPNLRALNCYYKCGFVEEGRKRQAVYIDGRFHDEIIMSVISNDEIVKSIISDGLKD
jgi:RimJ/RimL family protein N-acetyltransferase